VIIRNNSQVGRSGRQLLTPQEPFNMFPALFSPVQIPPAGEQPGKLTSKP
jgi:hypothetical protein